MANLNSNLKEIKGIGEKTSMILKKLGLSTVSDLLFYFPFRYEQYENVTEISNLKIGENVKVQGEIELIEGRRGRKRRMHLTEALINDGRETLKVIWFNQPYLSKTLKVGDCLSLSGKISDNYGQLTMVSPEYERIKIGEELINKTRANEKEADEKNASEKSVAANLVPIYHLTEGHLTQKLLRTTIKKVLPLGSGLKEWLPKDIIKELKLIPLQEALNLIHFPKDEKEIKRAKQRLAFSNLFLRQLKSQSIKKILKRKNAPKINFQEEETRNFVNSLPFKLTDGQKKSAWEILKDLNKDQPMSRLLEGDVGSGKTLVAVIAMLNTALNAKKAALMVPSEILASQHFKTISKLLEAYNFKIALKTRSYKIGNSEEADLVIGTQTLIQEKSVLKNLGLVIVDEQHRFGVNQRKKIIDLNKEENSSPHFLSLTATPIPRSMSLAIYGDLDLSLIDELPLGRKKTKTKVCKENEREKIYDFIKKEIKNGRQAFFVYPLIKASDKISFKSAQEEYEKISGDDFKGFKVALIHGKLKKDEKEKIMANFATKKIDILMATTVIEVGIDIPNATIILIEGADRFGLAQLHQLRGRVNRSDLESYCFLFPSKDEIKNEKTIERLESLEKYSRGLDLAKIDLSLRGGGEVFGSYQSGFFDLSVLALFDLETIKKSRDFAYKILEEDEDLKNYPLLKAKLGALDRDFHLE